MKNFYKREDAERKERVIIIKSYYPGLLLSEAKKAKANANIKGQN